MVCREVDIIVEVAKERGILVHQIISRNRKRFIMAARKEAIRRIRKETSLTTIEIGQLFGYRDHTTVLHHLKPYLGGE